MHYRVLFFITNIRAVNTEEARGWVSRGAAAPPSQVLKDKLTISQPGGSTLCPTYLTPPRLSDLPYGPEYAYTYCKVSILATKPRWRPFVCAFILFLFLGQDELLLIDDNKYVLTYTLGLIKILVISLIFAQYWFSILIWNHNNGRKILFSGLLTVDGVGKQHL